MLLLNTTAPLAVGRAEPIPYCCHKDCASSSASGILARVLVPWPCTGCGIGKVTWVCPPDLISARLVHWISLKWVGAQYEGQHQEKGQECRDLNWGEKWGGRAGLSGLEGSPLLDQLSRACCSACALSLFAIIAPQVNGEHAGEGAGLLLSWQGLPDVPSTDKPYLLLWGLKALHLKKKKKPVRQDKGIIHCERKFLPSHRKHVASHALAETSGWPNLIKYSCCAFPSSYCDGSWHRSPKAFDRDNCPCWVLLLFQHPP